MTRRIMVPACMACLAAACVQAAAFDPGAASFDDLMVRMQRYGDTERKRSDKAAAREELFRRKGESLHYLVSHAHLRNLWVHVYTEHLVVRLDADEAVPVLIALLDADHGDVRKMAAYWLWNYDRPAHAECLVPLLAEAYTAGAAMRTLGKWRHRAAIPRIIQYLEDDDERRRIAAVNALREIGSPLAIPALLERLDDPVVTVRAVAVRALASFGSDVVKPVARVLEDGERRVRREAVKVLAADGSKAAVKMLRFLLDDADPLVRGDSGMALLSLDRLRAPGWIRRSAASSCFNADGAWRTPVLPPRQ